MIHVTTNLLNEQAGNEGAARPREAHGDDEPSTMLTIWKGKGGGRLHPRSNKIGWALCREAARRGLTSKRLKAEVESRVHSTAWRPDCRFGVSLGQGLDVLLPGAGLESMERRLGEEINEKSKAKKKLAMTVA